MLKSNVTSRNEDLEKGKEGGIIEKESINTKIKEGINCEYHTPWQEIKIRAEKLLKNKKTKVVETMGEKMEKFYNLEFRCILKDKKEKQWKGTEITEKKELEIIKEVRKEINENKKDEIINLTCMESDVCKDIVANLEVSYELQWELKVESEALKKFLAYLKVLYKLETESEVFKKTVADLKVFYVSDVDPLFWFFCKRCMSEILWTEMKDKIEEIDNLRCEEVDKNKEIKILERLKQRQCEKYRKSIERLRDECNFLISKLKLNPLDIGKTSLNVLVETEDFLTDILEKLNKKIDDKQNENYEGKSNIWDKFNLKINYLSELINLKEKKIRYLLLVIETYENRKKSLQIVKHFLSDLKRYKLLSNDIDLKKNSKSENENSKNGSLGESIKNECSKEEKTGNEIGEIPSGAKMELGKLYDDNESLKKNDENSFKPSLLEKIETVKEETNQKAKAKAKTEIKNENDKSIKMIAQPSQSGGNVK